MKVPAAWALPHGYRSNGDDAALLTEVCDAKYVDQNGWQPLLGLTLETTMSAGKFVVMPQNKINIEQHFVVRSKEREETRKGCQEALSIEAISIRTSQMARYVDSEPRILALLSDNTSMLGQGLKSLTKRTEYVDLHVHDRRHEAVARFFKPTTLQTMENALITGKTELKSLRQRHNPRAAVLASKLAYVCMS